MVDAIVIGGELSGLGGHHLVSDGAETLLIDRADVECHRRRSRIITGSTAGLGYRMRG